jgi:hypothetical protein
MFTIDYIICNEDRHWNNFGFVRNAESMEWHGLAPVYDSGTSLWYSTQRVGSPVECKPFSSMKNHSAQIKIVDDFSWFDTGSLHGIDAEIMDIFTSSLEVDEKRRTAIANEVSERCIEIGRMSAAVQGGGK